MNAYRNNHRRSMLALAIATALAVPAAWAQQAPVAQTGDEQTADDQTVELQTITVTAQGREEDILAVPYNISAVSGQAIEDAGILDTAELMRSIPGVAVVDRGARNSSVVSGIRIRGLNVDSSALGDYAVAASATVATYIDKTPLLANFLLSDIERVEVLRGPQGTLYGSGALGGAVRYILRQPEPGLFEGRVSGGVSSVDGSGSLGKTGSLMLNLPLGDTAALRVNGTVNDFPGATDYREVYVLGSDGIPVAPDGVLASTAEFERADDADFVEQNYGRVALRWQPNDRFDLTATYMAQADRFGGRRGTSLGLDGYGQPYGDLEVGSVQREPSARHVNLASLEASVDLGFATLTSSSARYDHVGDITSENTGFYAQNGWLAAFYYNYPRPMASAVRSYGDEAFTQELRLISNDDDNAFDYVIGAYYQDQERLATQDSYLRGFKQWWDAAYPAFADAVISDQDYLYRQQEQFQETAVYGELTWHATDTLHLTAGVRHFRDETDTQVQQTTGLWSSFNESSSSEGTEKDSRTLYKVNLSWQFRPDNQLYATVSEGYRRGGTNGTPTTGYFAEDPAWATYSADTVRNYEIGLKGALARMTYNVDVFYVDWQDPQVNTATTNWGFFAVQNAEEASTRGVEMELAGSAANGFQYSLGYTYTDAQLDADAVSADGAFVYGTEGMRLPGAPEHRANVSGSYSFPLGSALLTLRGDAYYQSETENALSLSPRFAYTMPGFSIINLSATYGIGDWDATLWLKNVTNEEGVTGVYTPEYMGTSPAQNYFGNGSKALVTLPRTVGVTLSYRF